MVQVGYLTEVLNDVFHRKYVSVGNNLRPFINWAYSSFTNKIFRSLRKLKVFVYKDDE